MLNIGEAEILYSINCLLYSPLILVLLLCSHKFSPSSAEGADADATISNTRRVKKCSEALRDFEELIYSFIHYLQIIDRSPTSTVAVPKRSLPACRSQSVKKCQDNGSDTRLASQLHSPEFTIGGQGYKEVGGSWGSQPHDPQ